MSENVQNIRQSYKLHHESHEKQESGINSRKKNLTSGKNPERHFQVDALSPILFVIEMMSLNYILRKCTGGYKFRKSPERANHVIYTDDIKLFAKNEK